VEIEQMSVQLSRLSERIDERQDAIAARLRVQYVEGRFWHLKTLLAASSSGDFQRRFRYLSAVTQREYEIMETYRKDAERIAEVERSREEARQGILAYKVSTEEKLAQIQGLKKQNGCISLKSLKKRNRMTGPSKNWSGLPAGSTAC
jgi:peptidoglycan hydrolase CwlO-like protein